MPLFIYPRYCAHALVVYSTERTLRNQGPAHSHTEFDKQEAPFEASKLGLKLTQRATSVHLALDSLELLYSLAPIPLGPTGYCIQLLYKAAFCCLSRFHWLACARHNCILCIVSGLQTLGPTHTHYHMFRKVRSMASSRCCAK